MRVASCGIHGFHQTIDLDVDEIRVFWTLESDEYAHQTAYHVILATSEPALASETTLTDHDPWDSKN
jgi:hypothetical protein